MTTASNKEPTIVRTERGLTIADTRITLYDVMDYLTAGYPAKLIREKLSLSDRQITAALSYIEAHQAEVEAEYQEVLKIAQENQQYWENRNRKHFAQLAAMPPKPGQEALRAKLQTWQERLKSKV
ncbi:DUF433 domain-containing protein [[Phormidium ambiguum] IAM M-71]|uniref:DUF433 domain-containing protein n=1 Tax=[Phormidium ambiguum] IAM M-71 TaxID=454136 RepID=A0A1U7IP06_9CYAN|nr:DUF433 domain-containing protein [Phormidium ambiguum]OKH38989.1 DUF433 domain-containing protein [Phormidium ambiguum IAM M-71]